MGIMNQMTVAVSGGSPEENRQLASIIHSCLQDEGFTNLTISEDDKVEYGDDNKSLRDLIHSFNPDLLDIPVTVEVSTDGDLVEPPPVVEGVDLDGIYN
jgi:hypothetical protein